MTRHFRNRFAQRTTPRLAPAWAGWLACCLLLLATAARAASLQATLDRELVYLGEQATLTLTFEDANPGAAPGIPAVNGAVITHQGQASQFRIENGRTQQTVSYTYVVTPRQVGEITIPAISVRAGNATLASQPLKLRVERPAPPTAEARAQAQQLAFLQLVPPKNELYVGETVVLELQLHIRNGVQNLSDFQIAEFPVEGFALGKQFQAQNANRQVSVGGVGFTLIPLRYPLTALKAGEWQLGPVTAAVTAHVPAARGRDPFDLPGFINRTAPQRVALSSTGVKLKVLPLPTEGRPADFTGAVGTFNLEASAGPTNVAVGDPITIRASLTGEGMIDQLTLPDFSAWRDFKVYPPTAKVDAPEQSLGLRGTKAFEVVAIPQNVELTELPALTFSFFDPRARAYRTLTAPPVPLTVRPAGASPPPSVALPGVRRDPETPAVSDIVPLKQRLGQPRPPAEPWIRQAWFLLLPGLPVAAWLAALGWRKRAESLANNPRLRRRREVDQWLRASLPELRAHAAAGRSDDFFGLLFRILQERLGERLDLPASAITEAVVDGPLATRGLAGPARDALHELFQRCNEARYAPVRDRRELSDLVPQLETAVRAVEALPA
jgi:hypothetical protein